MSEHEYDPDVPVTVSPVPLDMDSVETVEGKFIKFDIPWKPPVYKWLFTVRLPNDCRVYEIFDCRDDAMNYASVHHGVPPVAWFEDASECLSFHDEAEDYRYYITQENYFPLSPGSMKETSKESERE